MLNRAVILPITAAVPATLKEALTVRTTEALAERLLDDLVLHYGYIRDIRHATLGDLWRMARDLVEALDRWAEVFRNLPGAERMNIAVEVVWQWINGRGGVEAIREMVTRFVEVPLVGGVVRWMVGRLVTEETARRLIRLLLEIAVREIRDLRN